MHVLAPLAPGVYRAQVEIRGSAPSNTRWLTWEVSPDGTNWTVINTRTNTMNSTLLVGFAVCSRNNGYLDTATFDNVSVTGVWPPAVSQGPVSISTFVSGNVLQLSWPSDHIGCRGENGAAPVP